MSFQQLRGTFISKMVRAEELKLGPLTSLSLGELMAEHIHIGYPIKLPRAIIHSLPTTTAAVHLRGVIRILSQPLVQ